MPRIEFVRIRCPHCGEEFKVRVRRVESGQALECYACGDAVATEPHKAALKALCRYSEAVLDVEEHYLVEGDTVIPRKRITFS